MLYSNMDKYSEKHKINRCFCKFGYVLSIVEEFYFNYLLLNNGLAIGFSVYLSV